MNNIKKIIDVVKKTGDKVVITNDDGADFVLMPFSDYEKIVNNSDNVKDLSEEELFKQIDRDIALWKQEHSDEFDDFEGDDDYDLSGCHCESQECNCDDRYKENLQETFQHPWQHADETFEPVLEDESLPFDEDLKPFTMETEKNDSDWEKDDEDFEDELSTQEEEELKYEDIPPPPPSVNQIEPIIDINDKKQETKTQAETSDFMEEPVF